MKFRRSAWIFVLLSVIVCLSAVGCSEEHVHTEAVDAAIAATCTKSGKTEGKHCSVCGEILVAQTEVAALGHTEVLDAVVAATCTESGKTEGKHCSVCGEILVAQTEVAALGHTEVIDAAVAATCTAVGKTEGKHCSVCGEILVAQTEVAALGHTEVIDAAVEATYNTVGKTEGKHCSVCGAVTVKQQTVPALGKASLCKLYGTENEKDCILRTAVFGSWENYLKYYDPQQNCTMNYRLFLPNNYDPNKSYPLVVYMHEWGYESKDLSQMKINAVLSQVVNYTGMDVICVIPQCLSGQSWPSNPKTVLTAFALLEEVEKHLSVDPARRYITGNNEGAMGALMFIHNEPGYFAASIVAGMSAAGYGNYKALATSAIRMFCGGKGNSSFLTNMTNLCNKLKSYGADAELKVWQDMGQDVFEYSARKVEVVKWMLSQKKGGNVAPPESDDPEVCGPEALFEKPYYGSWNNYGVFTDPIYLDNMNYRVFLPRNYDPNKEYPMVIYMHGKGGESMNISEIGINSVLSQSISFSKAEVICVIPQCLPNCYWPVNPYTVDVVFRLFEDLQKHLSVDKNRIYVSGHSYGAMGTLLLLQKHPDYFAAAMITAGAASSYTNYYNLAKTPLRMFCGDQDEYRFYNNMLPLYNKLKSLGADVEYTVWPGKGHGVFSYSAQQTSVVKWLLEQRLDD